MQKNYQDAANNLQKPIEDVLAVLRNQLAESGLDIDKIPRQPMAVEIVSFALVNCLTNERLAFEPFADEQPARQEAMEIVKAAIVQYRGGNLVPKPKHQIH